MAVKSTTRPPATKAATKAPAKAGAKATADAPAKAAASKPVTITLKQLALEIAEQHDMPHKQAEALLSDTFSKLVVHLKEGERVRIGGLGIIEVKDRPARMGRNPATGEAMQIKASKKIAFRVAKELKEAI